MAGKRFTIDDLLRKGFVVNGDKGSKAGVGAQEENRSSTKKVKVRKFGILDSENVNRIQIKPLSVNECWKGKRFKTDAYKDYEKDLLRLLQPMELPATPYKIYFEFGFSNSASDWDNPVKPLQDILQKRYGFNDKDIQEAHVVKRKVKQGSEYLEFRIETSKI